MFHTTTSINTHSYIVGSIFSICFIPLAAYPNCLQATLASLVDQSSSQMVPQVSFQHSSTRPWAGTELPASLRSPLLQTTEIVHQTG